MCVCVPRPAHPPRRQPPRGRRRVSRLVHQPLGRVRVDSHQMYHYTPPEQDASRRRNNNLAPVVNFGADQQQGWDSSWEQHQQPQPQHASGAYNGGAAQQWQQQQQQWQQQQPQPQQQQQQWQYAAPTAQGAYSGQMQPGYSGQMQMQPGAYSGQMPPGSFSGQMDGYGGQMDGAAQAQAPAKAQSSSITRNISATLLGEGEGDEPPILEGAPAPALGRAAPRRVR